MRPGEGGGRRGPAGRGEPPAGLASAAVAVPATCGELVQGWLDGVAFHVSCPVDRFAVVRVTVGPDAARRAGCATPRPAPALAVPRGAPKAARALRLALEVLGAGGRPAALALASSVPRGLGMGSSTADVAGAVAAAGLALGRPFASAEVARLALAVEPTDGSVLPGLALLDHREGRLLEPLGPPPPLALLVLGLPGVVDTVAFNRVDRRSAARANAPRHRDALAMLLTGLAADDAALVGAAASLSAEANEAVLPKPALGSVRRLARAVGAAGVVAAHSGSVLGILLDPRRHDLAAVHAYVARRLPPGVPVRLHRLVGGGARPLVPAPRPAGRPEAQASAAASGVPVRAARAGSASRGALPWGR